jgi:hypothetical protein
MRGYFLTNGLNLNDSSLAVSSPTLRTVTTYYLEEVA